MRLVIDKKELELLLEQIKEFKPKYVAVYNEESAQKLKNIKSVKKVQKKV